MDLVSIIIPVYKVEKYLDRCVESVVNQTYKNLEIILVDDGSPDNCPQMCDEWAKKDKRIKVIHKENGGVSSARNLGIEKATGDYIAFVDSDDWVDKDMYEKLFQKATETDADMVFCKFRKVYSNGKVIENKEVSFDKLKEKEIKWFFAMISDEKGNKLNVFGAIWRILAKRKIVQQCKFNTNLSIGEDLFYVLDCIEKSKKIETIDDVLYNYFENEQSVLHVDDKKRDKKEKQLYLFEKDYFKKKKLDYDYYIKHSYVCNNIGRLCQRKHSIKEIKDFYKNDTDIKDCLNKSTYKRIKKEEKGFKLKIRNFLIYHKMWHLYALSIKVMGKLKRKNGEKSVN